MIEFESDKKKKKKKMGLGETTRVIIKKGLKLKLGEMVFKTTHRCPKQERLASP